MQEMLRVGSEAIVSFPNFGHWRARSQIALGGHMPVSKELPYQWYDTPNVHHCTLVDFEALCAKLGLHILERLVLTNGNAVTFLPNLLGSLAVYRVSALVKLDVVVPAKAETQSRNLLVDACIQYWIFASTGISFSRQQHTVSAIG